MYFFTPSIFTLTCTNFFWLPWSQFERVNKKQSCAVINLFHYFFYLQNELLDHGLPEGIDAVVNLSGQNVLNPLKRWTKGFEQNVTASRVETNRMLSAAIRQSSKPPKVFISISGVGFYPPHPDLEYTEDSPGGDFDFLSKLCQQWENAIQVGPQTRTLAVRSGIVLGRDGGMIKQMYPLFWLGLGAKIGSGNQFMPWIHVNDLIRVFIEAMKNEKMSKVINGTAPQLITNGQFTKAFGSAMWRPAFLTVPEFVIEKLVFGPERAVMMIKGQKVHSRLTELGFKYQYPDIDSCLKQVVSG